MDRKQGESDYFSLLVLSLGLSFVLFAFVLELLFQVGSRSSVLVASTAVGVMYGYLSVKTYQSLMRLLLFKTGVIVGMFAFTLKLVFFLAYVWLLTTLPSVDLYWSVAGYLMFIPAAFLLSIMSKAPHSAVTHDSSSTI